MVAANVQNVHGSCTLYGVLLWLLAVLLVVVSLWTVLNGVGWHWAGFLLFFRVLICAHFDQEWQRYHSMIAAAVVLSNTWYCTWKLVLVSHAAHDYDIDCSRGAQSAVSTTAELIVNQIYGKAPRTALSPGSQ